MKVDARFGLRIQLLDTYRFGFHKAEDFIKGLLEDQKRLKNNCDVIAIVFCIVYKISVTGNDIHSMILRYKNSSKDFVIISEVIDDTLDYFVRNMEVIWYER